ncbi:MAG: chemotaxis protein CheA [Sphingobium sp.]
MDELLSEFVAETQESLEALTHVVVALEKGPSDRALLDQLFRFFHTVKGSCGFLDLPRFERLSHAAEDVLADIRSGGTAPDVATISAVLAVMDRIGELCVALDAGESLPDRQDEQLIAILLRCHAMAQAAESSGVGNQEAAPGEGAEGGVENRPEGGTEWSFRAPPVSRTVRLPLQLIDQLMNGVSDMVLARNELARKLRAEGVQPETDAAFERLSSSIAEMRDTISKTRMQRVDRLFMAIPRMVRDLSRGLGKTITLSIEGGDVEMDREMVELVIDPLTHIVRNSIDHGIEMPEQRLAAGKPEAGHLRLSAYQSGSQIVIEVVDDGRGIDVDAVAAKAIEAGLITDQEALRLDHQEKLDLIFAPGISTAREVTAVSGRGVGMDIVRANIERIGGVIALASEPGQGLSITMRVPLTLTIIPGLVLNAGGVNFAIPRSAVIEIVHDSNPAVSITRLGGAMTARIRDARYSMIDLESVIGVPVDGQSGPRSLMVVRSASGIPYILAVSQVENHEELVIRPAAPIIMATGIYGGMTLPDSGQPMLLLDAAGIAQAARLSLVAETVETAAPDEAAAERPDAWYPALRFIELTGEERVIRLSLVDRVEDVPIDQCMEGAGFFRVRIGDSLLPSPHGVRADQLAPGMKDVTCLRIRDGMREICYPIRAVVDIDEVPVEMDLSVRHGVVAGLVLIDGKPTEVVDGFALMAAVGEAGLEPEARPVSCVIADPDDIWNREILAPLLRQAGYQVRWGAPGEGDARGDIVLLTGAEWNEAGEEERSAAADAAAAILRLRTSAAPTGPDDTSIYRYDRAALLGALSSLEGERERQSA